MSSYISLVRTEGVGRQERCHPFSLAGNRRGPKRPTASFPTTTLSLPMALPPRTETDLRRELTGLVVESLAVRQDLSHRSVRCAACAARDDDTDGDGGADADRTVGDGVCVVLREYEGFTWEIQDLRCPDHCVDRVADAAGVEADDQVVVAAVLEAAGYHSPDGQYHPEALTLGAVEVIDYSPASEGYHGRGPGTDG
jgi:hypothetical protein